MKEELVAYGRKSVALFEDSLDISSGNSRDILGWLRLLPRQDRNTILSLSKDIARNQVRSIENHIDKIEGKLLRRDRHAIEWHRKFILAISCLVLFFVGAPLGVLLKKGGIGLPIVFLYHLQFLVLLYHFYGWRRDGEKWNTASCLGYVA